MRIPLPKQFGVAAIFVVLNDSDLEAVRGGQKQHPIFSEFIKTDFAKIAEAFGCQGIGVRNPKKLAWAINQALQSNEPFVIYVLSDPNERIRDNMKSPWAQKELSKI